MWIGKIAIIMYVFSVSLMFSGYYIDQAFGMELFNSYTYAALEELLNKQSSIDQSITAELIFGDFIAGAKVVFGILTGDTISGALSAIPNFNETWMIIVSLMFTLSSALLWVFVIAGRPL